MKLFNKVAIIGTGLIGGSIALAMKNTRLAKKIVGISRHKNNLRIAKKRGAIDEGSQRLDVVKGADLVIFAVPVNSILNLAPRVVRFIDEDCVVMDVGSTKQEIVLNLQRLFPNFIGAHPLAGSEKKSIVYAHPRLFKDTLCILTPTRKTNPRLGSLAKRFWNKLGARTVFLTPADHDKILAFVSHLPHIIAFSLINTVPSEYFKFSATGLKDTTRIAASDSLLWAEIFLTNKRNALKAIGLFDKQLSKIRSAILRNDKKTLSRILSQAKIKKCNLDASKVS